MAAIAASAVISFPDRRVLVALGKALISPMDILSNFLYEDPFLALKHLHEFQPELEVALQMLAAWEKNPPNFMNPEHNGKIAARAKELMQYKAEIETFLSTFQVNFPVSSVDSPLVSSAGPHSGAPVNTLVAVPTVSNVPPTAVVANPYLKNLVTLPSFDPTKKGFRLEEFLNQFQSACEINSYPATRYPMVFLSTIHNEADRRNMHLSMKANNSVSSWEDAKKYLRVAYPKNTEVQWDLFQRWYELKSSCNLQSEHLDAFRNI
jgi:hypothetical protein